MNDHSQKIAQLSPEQRDLLLRRAREGQTPGRGGIRPRQDRNAPAPLSFAQQRLWLLDRLQPGAAAYNIPVAVRITGPLDGEILRETLARLIRRHEALRTTLQEIGGEAVQVVESGERLVLEEVDLGHLPAAAAERAALELCVETSRRPFDLSRGPLLRMTLVRLGAGSHMLLLVFHHVISDLWSLGVFIRELTRIYGDLEEGRTPVLPELPIQYADYAAWQREELQGERLKREIEHWREELAGVSFDLELPGDHPRPPVMRYRGTRLPVRQLAGRLRGLQELARQEDATLFMALLAVYGVLLARWSGRETLAIGAPVANRSRVEVEGLIGFFINMLVLRADLDGNPTFRELLGRVKERCVRALNHQELPFEQLVDDLKLERDLSRPPLIQAAMALQNVKLPPLVLAGLRFEVMDIEVGIAKFDLSLELFEKNDMLEGWLEYNAEIFEPETAERIARCFSLLQEGLEEGADLPVWELPLLSESERKELLAPGGGAGRLPSLPERIAEVARRSPEAPAAVGKGGKTLSYGELVDRAGRVAGALRARGVGPETLVGILLERSPELLVAVLGTLGAGGACLLLDPGRERVWLERVLERAGCALVLTRASLVGWLPEHGADEALLERLEEKGEPIGSWEGIDPGSLAFVVQTSGARRRPPLIELPHRALAAWAEAWRGRLDSRDLAAAGGEGAVETVDGIFDLLMPLALGGCVETRKGAPVSLWSATPARLAERLLAGELGGARAVRAFGERLGKSLRERLRAAGVERVLDSFSSAPAGVRPAEGLAGQILGRLDAPAPDGAAGELWLGGEALARGYRGEPDRTAERFAPDPFGREPGARRARTGDLARRRPGGGLELWGPAGPQGVSPRLDVVEELLEEHPRVVRAAAVFQEDGNGPRLVAHAWTEAGGPEPGELRELLRERLPETRVPWQLTVLGELPLTPAGRLDPEGLPRVEVRTEAAGAAPRTEVERMLVEIWSELLGVGEVGIHDNFFQLGGNSLLATRVVARINEVFQLSLGVETLFRSPTVADLALATDEHLLVQLGDAGLESLLGEARRA